MAIRVAAEPLSLPVCFFKSYELTILEAYTDVYMVIVHLLYNGNIVFLSLFSINVPLEEKNRSL